MVRLSNNHEIRKHTTESRTGRKIVAVLIFEVTSVKSPLIMIMIKITAVRGISAINRSSSATTSDKPDL